MKKKDMREIIKNLTDKDFEIIFQQSECLQFHILNESTYQKIMDRLFKKTKKYKQK